ncbi:MAG: LamG domain-containing protein [Candidatus Bathyarchaeia archaeon]
MSARRVLRTGGLWFDGVDDYAVVSYSSLLNVDEITITFWANVTASMLYSDITRRPGVFAFDFSSGYPDGNLCFGIRTTSDTFYAIYVPHAPYVGKWTFYSLTYKPGELKAYINSNLKWAATTVNEALKKNTEPIYIMAEQPAKLTQGCIDEVRIYNRSLSADEIKAIYERDELIRDGLVLYLDFSEYEGNVAYDKSGMGNHATIYGARWVVKRALRVLPSVR